jgi:hypothetical protein
LRFQPPTETDWVAVLAFVIAKGQGYGIDTSAREVILSTGDDVVQDAIFVPSRGVFVVGDELRVFVLDRDALLWKNGAAIVGWHTAA